MVRRASIILCLLACGSAFARPRSTPELDTERDKLIEQIIRGERVDAAVARFKELVKQRDPLIPTSYEAQQAARERWEATRAWREEWEKTADAEVGWRCRLAVDPANPPPTRDWPGDWGRVVRKEVVSVERDNPLEEPERWTLYEVKGQKRTYRFRGEGFGLLTRKRQFEAERGDLLLVCDGGRTTERKLPEAWREDFQSSGFAVRLEKPPRIVQKKKWNPIHITDNALFWAVKDGKWRFPEGAFVVSVVSVEEDLGNGRFLIDVGQELTVMLEVPATVPNRELLLPGQKAWAIMGRPRFDRELRKLVLQVEDVEPRYVDEVAPPELADAP